MTEKEMPGVSKKQDNRAEINRIYYFYKRSGYVVEDEMLGIIGKSKVLENSSDLSLKIHSS